MKKFKLHYKKSLILTLLFAMLQIAPSNIYSQNTTKLETNTDSLITSLETQLKEAQLFSINIVSILQETETKVKNGAIHIDELIKAIADISKVSADQNKTISQRNKQISKINKKLSRKKRDQGLYFGAGGLMGVGATIAIVFGVSAAGK